jgi:ubiquinone/menaquinone biosynthesis C-methylase UbiE
LILPDRRLVPRFHAPDEDGLIRLIYHPVSGLVYRRRFRMALAALAGSHSRESLLEVGFGAGLLLPSLARMFPQVEAIDIHGLAPDVSDMLRQLGLINVTVRAGSIFQLPFPDRHFSHVLSVSVLEHLRDLDAAACELVRVTRPGGTVVLGFPTKNVVTKALFRLVGYDDDVIHPSGHGDILAAMYRRMALEHLDVFPRYVPLDLSLYSVARFRVGANSI